jgi:uncharacterized membrane protein
MSELLIADVAAPGQRPGMLSPRSFFLVAAVFLLATGAALRVYHLGDRSLWYDEAVTANGSRGTFMHVLEKTRRCSAPVVHPYILYIAEKVGKGPTAARAPSAFVSILAILVMLAMVRTRVGSNAALFSAAILAFSASQIRYAQEVREYSLSVLVAASLVYCFLRWEAVGSRSRHPWLLYGILFLAPLVQYGLVFFAFGILGTIVLRLLLTRETSFTAWHAVIASIFLGVGGLLSFFLTLRYQFQPGSTPWYLAANYYDPKTMSLLHFLGTNSKGLLIFLIPGRAVDLCFVFAALAFCAVQAITRRSDSALLLVFTTVSITVCASVARVYPYGGIRQCLFLAPVLALFAAVALADLLQRLRGSLQTPAAIALLAVIMVSLYRGMLFESPYKEYEDTQTILKELTRSIAPNDQVWVNHDAVDAFQFYQRQEDRRFIYGIYHANMKEYVPELDRSIDPNSNRIWLVFSHLQQPSDRAEEQLIVDSLRPGWDVHRVAAPTNAELYVAYRRSPA